MKPVFDHCFRWLLKEPFFRIFRAVLKPNLAGQQFKSFICGYGVSVPLHRLRPITLISPLRATKYHAIRENYRGKWPTVSSPFTTFTACLSMGLINSRLATSFSPIDGFHNWAHAKAFPCSGVQTSLVEWLCGYQANVLYRSLSRSLIFVEIVIFFQLWALTMKITVVSHRE